MQVRKEIPSDIDVIQEIITEAFLTEPHSDLTEQFVVNALREAGVLSISLVVETSGQLVAHVAVSPIKVSDGSVGWYGLGPISVKPEEQGKGIGSMLMKSALEELKQIGAKGCVLLGEPDYYRRFGFKVFDGLVLPGFPSRYFQAILFDGELPQGVVSYHEAFNAKQ